MGLQKGSVASIVLAALCFCTPAASGATYNSVSDFSNSANPNGPWTYKSVAVGSLPSTATFMTYPQNVIGGGPSWGTTDPTDGFCAIGSGGRMHPGNTNDALLGFTNPLGHTASYTFTVDSTDPDNNNSSDGKILSMWLDNSQLQSQFLPGNFSTDITWQETLVLGAGQTFYLRLNENHTNFGDAQTESVTVTQVPEPAAFTLLAMGAAGTFFVAGCKCLRERYATHRQMN